mgnify:CR=1 FL=1
MTDSDYQDIINKALDEFCPENLKLHFMEAEEAYQNEDALGLDYLAHFAAYIAGESLSRNHISHEIIGIIEKAKSAVDESKSNEKVLFWPNSVIIVYPMLVSCYIAVSNWIKAESALDEYIEYLNLIYDNGGIPEPMDEDTEIENLRYLVEQICEYHRANGDDSQIMEVMTSISRFIRYSNEETQFKYYAALSELSFSLALENYKCLKEDGPDDGVSEELQNIYSKFVTFLVFHLEISGNDFNLQLSNICLKLVALDVFHLLISTRDNL